MELHILKVDPKAQMALVKLSKMEIWIPKAMLKQYGVRWADVKEGITIKGH